MPPLRAPRLALFVAFALGLSSAPAQPPPVASPPSVVAPPPLSPEPWSLADVPLPPSPRVTRGRLENGLRYAILPHTTPPGHISLRLLVQAGALHENDAERSFAHFVEHMAFNGTKNFPAGELIKVLQRQGAQFGPHTNATTGLTSTVYQLELPDNSAASLETGLRIFRDFADGILFEPAEVRRERGVILSEKSFRSSLGSIDDNSLVSLEKFLFAGMPALDRAYDVIGSVAQIEHADRAGLRRFYDAWYRPERMTVVIVGDIDPARAESLLRARFANFTARGPHRPEPDPGRPPALAAPLTGLLEKKEDSPDIHVVSLVEIPHPDATWGARLESTTLSSAVALLQKRIDARTNVPDSGIVYAGATVDLEYERYRQIDLNVSALDPANAEAALALVEQETRRAIEFGFTSAELEPEKDRLRAEIHAHAESAPTAPAGELCEQLINALAAGAPFLLPDESVEAALQTIDRLTSAGCQQSLRTAFDPQRVSIFAICPAGKIPAAAKLRAAYLASHDVPLALQSPPAPATPAKPATPAPQDFGPPGAIVEKQHIADLDLWLVRFANGVRLSLKRTPFEHGLAHMRLRYGTGRLGEPAGKPGLALMAPALLGTRASIAFFSESSASSTENIDKITASTSDDAFILKGQFHAANAPTLFRTLPPLFTKPDFTTAGFNSIAIYFKAMARPQPTSAIRVVEQYISPRLAGGDPRCGLPTNEILSARTVDELRAWLTPQITSGPLEIAVVGDIEIDAFIATVAQTLGTLPARQPKSVPAELRKLNFPATPVVARYTHEGAVTQPTTLRLYWPVRDPVTASQQSRLELLSIVLNDRVTDEVREKAGDTYTTESGFFKSDAYPGFAFIECTVAVPAKKAARYAKLLRNLGTTLARHGVTLDELLRAKTQSVAFVHQAQTDNDHWLGVLAGVHENPGQLDEARSHLDVLSATTVADLNALAARYLTAKDLCEFTIVPEPPKTPAPIPTPSPRPAPSNRP